ncbi:hypothetical protein B296_00023695 [Ensete ventricosum]|uniref:RING-type E3 ubiquitin transferase n=1 Tax=Ensete ventricosum TaxID=4639 RepID=A0A426XYU4_ENSVE|nr:hypothetical protein B296_00023695 [Ensete ventricosum]
MAETTKGAALPLVAVAVDKDKSSQAALKWALDNVVIKNQILILIHVNTKASCKKTYSLLAATILGITYLLTLPSDAVPCRAAAVNEEDAAAAVHELLLPFRCFCQRKDVGNCGLPSPHEPCRMFLTRTFEHLTGELRGNRTGRHRRYEGRRGLRRTGCNRQAGGGSFQKRIYQVMLSSSSTAFFHGIQASLLIQYPHRLRSFRSADISTSISKSVPDFCTTYVVTKGKLSTTRNAIRAAPTVSPLRAKLQSQATRASNSTDRRQGLQSAKAGLQTTRFSGDSDTSFASSSRTSTDRSIAQRFSYMSDGTDRSSESAQSPTKSFGAYSYGTGFSSLSHDSSSSEASVRAISPPLAKEMMTFLAQEHMYNIYESSRTYLGDLQDYVEAEMNRLRSELKQTMDMYSTACKEAIGAKQKLHLWNMGEQQRLEEARVAEGAAFAMVEKEKAKYKAALEAAEVAKLIADSETQKRRDAEMKLVGGYKEDEALHSCSVADLRYRKYTIDEIEAATDRFAKNRKIGEGTATRCSPWDVTVSARGKGSWNHSEQALSVLTFLSCVHCDGRQVEILSCIRHPNMVLLLGACPEYGCLVYEHMANGSLEDRLFRRENTPPIPWRYRFRIAAEIGTGLLFLHQTKPEPLVHRDLKPGNILLDQNYVSKISDVGLARLVPPSVADEVTQYRMTSAAGTFCYIDPEYQQTGMLGTKSDVYSLGVLLLQLITGRPPMGLTHHVGRSIERGTFAEMLDPSIRDWPVEEALSLAKLALRCVELRRRDRPDLATIILPALNRLRAIGVDDMRPLQLDDSILPSPQHSEVSVQDLRSGPLHLQSGYESPRSRQYGELSIFRRR